MKSKDNKSNFSQSAENIGGESPNVKASSAKDEKRIGTKLIALTQKGSKEFGGLSKVVSRVDISSNQISKEDLDFGGLMKRKVSSLPLFAEFKYDGVVGANVVGGPGPDVSSSGTTYWDYYTSSETSDSSTGDHSWFWPYTSSESSSSDSSSSDSSSSESSSSDSGVSGSPDE